MPRIRSLFILLAGLALVAVACGGGEEPAASPIPDPTEPGISSACLADTPDCDDTVVPGEEPTPDDSGEGDVTSGVVIPAGGITIAEALAEASGGTVALSAFVFIDDGGARVCDAVAESFPPQCGGESLELSTIETVDPDDLEEAQGIRWTNDRITLFGEIVDGIFVIDPMTTG